MERRVEECGQVFAGDFGRESRRHPDRRRASSREESMKHRIAMFIMSIAIPLLSASAIRAQSTPEALPRFEAISIRPCNTGNGRSPDGAPSAALPTSSPGRLSICGRLAGELGPPPQAPFEGLIEDAYGKYVNGRINPPWAIPKVEGGPAWLRNDPYTITAHSGKRCERRNHAGTDAAGAPRRSLQSDIPS